MDPLTFDRELHISVGDSRKSTVWKPLKLTVSELYTRLETPVRGEETQTEYFALPKAEQDSKKDVGGFVGGRLSGSRRKADNVLDRCIVTLDFDHVPAHGVEAIFDKLEALNCGYCVYSTRKHRPEAPRLRVLIVLDSEISAEEYTVLSRILAQKIGMEWADPTTFEAHRLMYWPSRCADGDHVFQYKDAAMLNASKTLQEYSLLYGDWRTISNWPRHPEEERIVKRGKQQADPTGKSGAVGAFCRLYTIERVMSELLPGVYEPVENDPNRFTYLNGSTTGGAVIYDNGKFLYSHHATDPCGEQLVNAFDLVRLHKFGALDAEAQEGTPGGRLPSYTAALRFIKELPDVNGALTEELAADGRAAFAPFVADGEPDANGMTELMNYAEKSLCAGAVRAMLKVLKYDIRTNLSTGRAEVEGLPVKYSRAESLNTLPVILRDVLKQTKIIGVTDTAISGYLSLISDENRYQPVCDMMKNECWDGADRLSEVYSVLNVTDSFYKLLIKKWLIQCVAMANNSESDPYGADGALVLQGPQGCGKTEFFRRLAVEPDWFVEGLSLDMNQKDSVMKSVGCWICELGELDSTTHREQSSIKGHITAATDAIRAPYARAVTRSPRRTSFCATVNPNQFLTDNTGNRRFWVVPVQRIELQTLLNLPKNWFRQLWAQVYEIWAAEPEGFRLTPTERDELNRRNSDYEVLLPGESEVLAMLSDGFDKLPENLWTYHTVSEMTKRLSWTGTYIKSQQMGRVLAKLARVNDKVKAVPGGHRTTKYRLPIPADYTEIGRAHLLENATIQDDTKS